MTNGDVQKHASVRHPGYKQAFQFQETTT